MRNRHSSLCRKPQNEQRQPIPPFPQAMHSGFFTPLFWWLLKDIEPAAPGCGPPPCSTWVPHSVSDGTPADQCGAAALIVESRFVRPPHGNAGTRVPACRAGRPAAPLHPWPAGRAGAKPMARSDWSASFMPDNVLTMCSEQGVNHVNG